MNWFKKTFGKRHWETVWSSPTKAYKTSLFSSVRDLPAVIELQIDKEFNEYRVYVTDYNSKSDLSIKLVNYYWPEVKAVLDEYKIPY